MGRKRPVKILTGCEFSGVVRDAFIRRGHDAVSCDILDTESPGPHLKMDIMKALYADEWDMIFLFPECRYMAVSGNRWYADDPRRMKAVRWTVRLWDRARKRAPMVCLENPVSVLWNYIPRSQYIQMWEHGHKETKRTGFALHGLPLLKKSRVVGPPPDDPEERKSWERVWRMAPGDRRSLERSRFLPGVARAMARQWG